MDIVKILTYELINSRTKVIILRMFNLITIFKNLIVFGSLVYMLTLKLTIN